MRLKKLISTCLCFLTVWSSIDHAALAEAAPRQQAEVKSVEVDIGIGGIWVDSKGRVIEIEQEGDRVIARLPGETVFEGRREGTQLKLSRESAGTKITLDGAVSSDASTLQLTLQTNIEVEFNQKPGSPLSAKTVVKFPWTLTRPALTSIRFLDDRYIETDKIYLDDPFFVELEFSRKPPDSERLQVWVGDSETRISALIDDPDRPDQPSRFIRLSERLVVSNKAEKGAIPRKAGERLEAASGGLSAVTEIASEATILVRPAGEANLSNESVQSLTSDQPFHVELRVPRERAEESVELTIGSAKTGKTTSMSLEPDPAPSVRGRIVYKHSEPTTMSQLMGKTITWRDFENDDTITIAYGGAKAQFSVYDSWVQKGIATLSSAFASSRTLLNHWINRADVSHADKQILQRKLDLVTNAQKLLDFRDDIQTHSLKYTDYKRFRVAEHYLNLLLTDASTWRPGGFHSPVFGITMVCGEEMAALTGGLEQGERDLANGQQEFFKQSLMLSVGMIESFVILSSMIGVNQSVMVFFGVDVTGRWVSMTERILAGISLASMAAAFTASHLAKGGGPHALSKSTRRPASAPKNPSSGSAIGGAQAGALAPPASLGVARPNPGSLIPRSTKNWVRDNLRAMGVADADLAATLPLDAGLPPDVAAAGVAMWRNVPPDRIMKVLKLDRNKLQSLVDQYLKQMIPQFRDAAARQKAIRAYMASLDRPTLPPPGKTNPLPAPKPANPAKPPRAGNHIVEMNKQLLERNLQSIGVAESKNAAELAPASLLAPTNRIAGSNEIAAAGIAAERGVAPAQIMKALKVDRTQLADMLRIYQEELRKAAGAGRVEKLESYLKNHEGGLPAPAGSTTTKPLVKPKGGNTPPKPAGSGAVQSKDTLPFDNVLSPKGAAQAMPTTNPPVPKTAAARPHNFGAEDVAFGLTRPQGETGALKNFAGNAVVGSGIPLSPGTQGLKIGPARNLAIAEDTVDYAKATIQRTGGRLRFSLKGFNTRDALTPGSKTYNGVTSAEFRSVLRDPFLRERTVFYNANGVDVTSEILRLAGKQ